MRENRVRSKRQDKRVVTKPLQPFIFLAQREGFEPSYTFLHNTISNRARSTAPPSLQTAFILYMILRKKASIFRGSLLIIFKKIY